MQASNSEERTLINEFVLLKFREKLKNDSIKLWMPPYYSAENKGQSEDEMKALQDLTDILSLELGTDRLACYETLRYLQQNALEKLQERNDFKETGVATIRMKVSGIPSQKPFAIATKLDVPVSNVHKMVAEKLKLTADRIKLISNGKVLMTDKTLSSHGIQNGCQLMAIILAECSGEKLRKEEEQLRTVQQMREDIGLLTKFKNDSDPYLRITDQSGNTLYLPDEEKKSLVTAMTLHEKGRVALKKEDYALALVFLLEADKEFSACRSQLLEKVDNFALLNLDIAWCYLCLENIALLPDAEERLKQCESKFKYSYGPNLERIVVLKGSAGNEATLLMRLHLLQGIVLFYQNKADAALLLLNEAKKELATLKQNDSSLPILLEMGFTPAESRLALRATKGQVDEAAAYIQRRRQEYEDARTRDRRERQSRLLGKCADGNQWVSEGVVKQLVTMGFSRQLAVEALRISNNIIQDAIMLINENPESLMNKNTLKTLIKQLTELGFLPSMAKLALKQNNFNIEKAIEELTRNNGFIEGEVSDEDIGCRPSTSSGKKRNFEEEQEAFNRISEGLPESEIDDYLDSTLEQEERFLCRYLSILEE